jgi:cytochrome b561
MNWKNTTQRYGWLPITLHWFMLVLLAAVYACMELRDIFPKGSAGRDGMKTWHFMLGLSVLVLAALRLALAAAGSAPLVTPPLPRWQATVATLMKVALYVLMLGLPLAGWLILSASGKPVPFFGLTLPPLIAKSKETAHWIKEIHETGATVGYFLIGLHALAGLYHHYVVRDDTLKRMLWRRS